MALDQAVKLPATLSHYAARVFAEMWLRRFVTSELTPAPAENTIFVLRLPLAIARYPGGWTGSSVGRALD